MTRYHTGDDGRRPLGDAGIDRGAVKR